MARAAVVAPTTSISLRLDSTRRPTLDNPPRRHTSNILTCRLRFHSLPVRSCQRITRYPAVADSTATLYPSTTLHPPTQTRHLTALRFRPASLGPRHALHRRAAVRTLQDQQTED